VFGIALDERSDDDEERLVDGIPFVIGPRDREIVIKVGGVRVDYTQLWFGGASFCVDPVGRRAGGCC